MELSSGNGRSSDQSSAGQPRVLLAGVTGYLGGFVLREIRERGVFIRALVRSERQRGPVANWADEVIVCDPVGPGAPEILQTAAAGMDAVFSSIGITRQKDGLRYMDVDYGVNRQLLEAALTADAGRFVYVASLGAERMRDVALIRAKERFVRELQAAPIDNVVVRPSGFFSDLAEFLRMAQSGRVFLFGRSGRLRMNPIHGADLARVCVDALLLDDVPLARDDAAGLSAAQCDRILMSRTIAVGGPDILSHDQIAGLAFAALNRPTRISHLPLCFARAGAWLARRCLPESVGGSLDFLLHALSTDAVGDPVGTRRVADYFRELHSEYSRPIESERPDATAGSTASAPQEGR